MKTALTTQNDVFFRFVLYKYHQKNTFPIPWKDAVEKKNKKKSRINTIKSTFILYFTKSRGMLVEHEKNSLITGLRLVIYEFFECSSNIFQHPKWFISL